MRMESENATRKTASAAKTREPTSPRLRSGTSSQGRPLGTGPVIDTPWPARSSAHDAAMPATTRMSAPGIRLLTRPGHDQQREGHRTDDDRDAVGVAEVAHDVDGLADGAVLVAGDAEQLAELAEDEHDGDPGDVADQHRLGEVVGDPADAGHARHEEDHPHHDREHRGERGVLRAPAGGERSDRRRDQQRDGALRPDGHPRRGPQEGVRQHREQQRVEPGADRDTGQLRVRHGCRQRQRRHRDPSERRRCAAGPASSRPSTSRTARTASSSAVGSPTRTRRAPCRPC